MAAPGDNFRKVWTADFYNRLRQLLEQQGTMITVSGRGGASTGKRGSQIVIPKQQNPLSTIQGVLSGGSAPSVTDGTVVIDPYAWLGYSIQAAYFVCAAGTTNATVLVGGTPVSWLNSLPITASGHAVFIANPPPDLTHLIPTGESLSIQLSGSSSNCTGFQFSLNCPF